MISHLIVLQHNQNEKIELPRNSNLIQWSIEVFEQFNNFSPTCVEKCVYRAKKKLIILAVFLDVRMCARHKISTFQSGKKIKARKKGMCEDSVI